MNRIILIGNGFDLAHGMKTSYNHFINDYWKKIIDELRMVVNGNITTYLYQFETNEIKIEDVPGHLLRGNWVKGHTFEDLITSLKSRDLQLIFKNHFLEILTKKHRELNWVDIENEYYDLLKESFKNKDSGYTIEELNKDFNQIKKLLESYLREVENSFKANFGTQESDNRLLNYIGYNIYSPFQLRDFTEILTNKIVEERFQKFNSDLELLRTGKALMREIRRENQNMFSQLSDNTTQKDFRKLLLEDTTAYFEQMPDEILLLSFNYTFTEKLYSSQNKFNSNDSTTNILKQYIHIHGTTDKNDHNDVIFGFGDEIDEDYKSIENLNDNIYLENIKSIQYLETDNYKQLLEFLNSGEYQIFIFGHSCGISDRTLLNTLFEHENCVSIKPFFHKKEDGSDNYSDIIRNISRNFNSKVSMRDKVVNKKYCNPLT